MRVDRRNRLLLLFLVFAFVPLAGNDKGACDPEPQCVVEAEVCDGLDNDCDGLVDEDLGVTSCGLGACLHTVDNCIGGQAQVCDSLAGAAAEICNGLDDDCDGAVDEDLGDTTCGLGPCAHTEANCADGQEQFCDPLAGAVQETCNGIDDDCDGSVDEELGADCPPCEAGSYAPAGVYQCASCAPGTVAPYVGSTSCFACPLGTVALPDHKSCAACAANSYANEERSACLPCPEGTASPAGSDDVSDCVPVIRAPSGVTLDFAPRAEGDEGDDVFLNELVSFTATVADDGGAPISYYVFRTVDPSGALVGNVVSYGPSYQRSFTEGGAWEVYVVAHNGYFLSAATPPLDDVGEPETIDVGSGVAPGILSFTASDPDNCDSFYGAGDTLTIVFDADTDQGGLDSEPLTKAQTDGLFLFSRSVGLDYTGQWIDPATFVITVVTPGDSPHYRLRHGVCEGVGGHPGRWRHLRALDLHRDPERQLRDLPARLAALRGLPVAVLRRPCPPPRA